jgi:hypothetical protein
MVFFPEEYFYEFHSGRLWGKQDRNLSSEKTFNAEPIIAGESIYVPTHSQKIGQLRDGISQTDGIGYAQISGSLETKKI